MSRMAAGGEEERKKRGGLPYKHGFMTQCPPPEAAYSATDSWVASSRQLEGCCPSVPRKSWLGPWGGGRGWSSASGLVRGGGAVGDHSRPSWTHPETRCHAHRRSGHRAHPASCIAHHPMPSGSLRPHGTPSQGQGLPRTGAGCRGGDTVPATAERPYRPR